MAKNGYIKVSIDLSQEIHAKNDLIYKAEDTFKPFGKKKQKSFLKKKEKNPHTRTRTRNLSVPANKPSSYPGGNSRFVKFSTADRSSQLSYVGI